MKRDLVDVRYCEIVSGVKKQYKDIKPKYRSNFHKLVKMYDTHRIYCENFDWSDIDEGLIPTEVLQELIMIKVSNSVHKRICYTFTI